MAITHSNRTSPRAQTTVEAIASRNVPTARTTGLAGYKTFGDLAVAQTDAYADITWSHQGSGIWQIDIEPTVVAQANPKDGSTIWFPLIHPATGETLDWSAANPGFLTLILEVVSPLSVGDDIEVSVVMGDGDWSAAGQVTGGGILYDAAGPTTTVWRWNGGSLTKVEDATPSTNMQHVSLRSGQKTVTGDGNIQATGYTAAWVASATADTAQTWHNIPYGNLVGINCRPDAAPAGAVSIQVRPRYSLHTLGA